MSVITSAAAGNWSAGGTWVGGVAPGNGDVAIIHHAVVVDVNVTVGLSNTLLQTMTGTVASSGTTVTGTGTLFLTELKVGDVVAMNTTSIRTVLAIADDTHFTTGLALTLAAGKTIKNNPTSVFVDGVNFTGSLTINAGVTLTLRGNLCLSGGSLNLNAGALYVFDSSLASGTPIYSIYLGCGEGSSFVSSVTANGSAGSHCSFGIAASSGKGRIQMTSGNPGGNVDCTYTDFASMGSSTIDSISVLPIASAQKFKLAHCTFTNLGRIATNSFDGVHGSADLSFTFNEVISVPADPAEVFWCSCYAKTSGLRVMTDNVFALPDKDCHVDLSGGVVTGWTVTRNVFGRVDGPATSGPFTSFTKNFFYARHLGAGTLWSFVGVGGDTITANYFINDEGPAQANQHQLMSNDNPVTGGTYTLSYLIFERSGLPTSGSDFNDVSHLGGPSNALTYVYDHCLVLPMYNGWSSGRFRGRGNALTTIKVTHCTLMIDPSSSGLTNDGGVLMGNSYAGFANMFAEMRDNLCWSKTQSAGGARGGFSAAYDRAQLSPVADLMTAASIDYNAHYNALTGTIYDAAGANGTSLLGYDGWRQTVKPTATHDVNLSTGSNEGTSGPKFVDSSRNLATFDSAYLLNTATAWANSTGYVVGDLVSTQNSGFYANAVINFRCVKTHTSNSANATNGQPGGTTATSYRTNWEFVSAYRIRQAILAGTTITNAALGLSSADYITALSAWVTAGFAPRNSALHAGHDGSWIGAVDGVAGSGSSGSLLLLNAGL